MQHNYLSLSEAANSDHVPGRPSANAIWRWCRKGVKSRAGERVRLEHIRVGGKIFTCPDWLNQFFSKLAASDADYFSETTPAVQVKRSSVNNGQREKRIAQAEKRLEAAGIV